METPVIAQIRPEDVHRTVNKHLFARDVMPMVLDMEKSQGIELYDKVTGRRYYDFFGFYASIAVGVNHPKLTGDSDFVHRLTQAALNKVTNSDVLTEHLARFVKTFGRVGIPDYLPYAFFIDGGSLAVENALKAAFDWKVRKNFAKGYRREVGHQVLHFDQAFHGRSGYTLSLTNTADPRKTAYFPKFSWPRVLNPKVRFPRTSESDELTEQDERMALAQAKTYFQQHRDDIACIIIEPIQGEGGDNHFRPDFLRNLRDLAHENDALLVFDEVQTGVGISGRFWAHQALGVEPDILAFGKKTQVCGILAGRKLDEVGENVFHVASRINSTWGGNLVDMVRFDRILEVMEEDQLVEHAGQVGVHLQQRLHELADESPLVGAVRGIGLMCAFDMPSAEVRDGFLKRCYEKGLVILGCGIRTVRFRSPLIITEEEIDLGIEIIRETIREMEHDRVAG